ncbi:MAG: hypothetical protein II779_13605, partial [Clostridia bacterium]|nr:hypothetical protein [Clostridia bacterium]
MKTYMFCNAHLDPVWLWQWESGMSEAISTFRSASKMIDDYPDFVFNHNESLLYEWVEEHEPALFEKIREQVKSGRWKIVGGWFLQPDCNIPAGESILRQILRGRIYFYDKFGEVPVTAVNFDSFGHALRLAQKVIAQDFFPRLLRQNRDRVGKGGVAEQDGLTADGKWVFL